MTVASDVDVSTIRLDNAGRIMIEGKDKKLGLLSENGVPESEEVRHAARMSPAASCIIGD